MRRSSSSASNCSPGGSEDGEAAKLSGVSGAPAGGGVGGLDTAGTGVITTTSGDGVRESTGVFDSARIGVEAGVLLAVGWITSPCSGRTGTGGAAGAFLFLTTEESEALDVLDTF